MPVPSQSQGAIGPTTTVNDVLEILPAATGLLADRGLDTCCGGALTLEESCSDAGIELGVLLEDLAALSERSASARTA